MYIRIIILIVFSWCHYCVIADGGECARDKSTTTSRLKETLLCSYDTTTRPKLDKSNATILHVKMSLLSLSYDQEASMLSINVKLTMAWKDDHLVWKPSDHDGIKTVHMNSYAIWTPDLSVFNRAEEAGSPRALTNVDCLVSYDGNVTCQPPAYHQARCDPNLRRFPFDTLLCSVRYGSWVYYGEEINFTPTTVRTDYVENGEWELKSYNVTKFEEHIDEHTYPDISYNFVLQRYPGWHISTSLAALFVMMLMTILGLCHDPEDEDRFTLILINIFSHVMFLHHFLWMFLGSGVNVPLIMIFCRDSLSLTFFTLILTSVQKHLISKGQSPVWVSMIVSGIVNSKPGRYIFIFDDNMKAVANRVGDEDAANMIENSERQNNRDWIILSKILDQMCIFSFAIVYSIMIIAFMP